MLIKKTYKFRIYPNNEQIEMINKTYGCSRFVFNFFLKKQREKERYWFIVEEMVQNGQLKSNEWKGSFINKFEIIKQLPELKKNYPFLKEVDSIALQKSVENLADSYSRYYKKKNNAPRFKSKKHPVQSYTTKKVNENIYVDEKYIRLPKLGLIKYAKSREIQGRIMNVTIKRNATNKYYISVLVELEVQQLIKMNSSIGIDVGIKEFATLSDGNKYRNPKFLTILEKKLAKEQRLLSRRKQGGANWAKQRIKVARIHEKISNSRTDYLQKISTEIIKNHDIIGIENLSVKNMLQNNIMSKSISEASWKQFIRMLEYKGNWYGKKVIAVSKNYASSQICSLCSYKNKQVRNLNVRKWTCLNCGVHHDRDINASINIRNEAIRLLTAGTVELA